MPIPITVYLDTRESVPTLAQAAEFLDDLHTIFALSAAVAREEIPGTAPFDVFLTRATIGSLWVELLAHPDTAASAKAVTTFIAVLTGTPYLAALPQRVRTQWYRRGAEAEAAKLAYVRARRKGEIHAVRGLSEDLAGIRGRRRPGGATTRQKGRMP